MQNYVIDFMARVVSLTRLSGCSIADALTAELNLTPRPLKLKLRDAALDLARIVELNLQGDDAGDVGAGPDGPEFIPDAVDAAFAEARERLQLVPVTARETLEALGGQMENTADILRTIARGLVE